MNKTTAKSARKPARKIKYQHDAKGLTSQAGVIPAVHFLQQLGFDSICRTQLDLERGNQAKYTLTDAVFMTLIGMISGASSLLKVVAVWSDQVLREIGGWLAVPDDSTLGRIFKEGRLQHVVQLETVNHQLRQRVWGHALKSGALSAGHVRRAWIDVDSTVKTAFGRQEGAAKGYNKHKRGALSYHPQVAFFSETKETLQAWLRTGSAYTSNGITEFMKQLAAQMPPRMRMLFRGDSGYFVGELMDWLDAHGHGYLIKVKLKGLNALLDKQDWEDVPGHAGWQQCAFACQCGHWERSRLFLAVRRLRK